MLNVIIPDKDTDKIILTATVLASGKVKFWVAEEVTLLDHIGGLYDLSFATADQMNKKDAEYRALPVPEVAA